MSKKMSSAALLAAIFGLLAFVMASCTGDSEGKLYSYVPDNAVILAGVNFKSVAENAGCSVSDGVVELSPALSKLIGDNKRLSSILKAEGLDLNRMFVVGMEVKSDDNDIFLVASVTDSSKFDSFLMSNDMKKSSEKGMDVYTYSDYCTVVVDGGVAVYAPNGKDGVRMAKNLREMAGKFPLAEWKVDFLNQSTVSSLMSFEAYGAPLSNAGNDIDIEKLRKSLGLSDVKGGYIAYNIDLKGNECVSKSKCVDTYGKKINVDLGMDDINTSLLKYTDAVDCAALLFSLPSKEFLSKILDAINTPAANKATFITGYSYFKSVMVAAGPVDITKYWDVNGWHLVVALEIQPGKSQECFNIIKMGLPSLGILPQVSGNDITFRLPDNFRGYIKLDGDNIIASISLPISSDGASRIKASDFGKYPIEMLVDIPAHSAATTMIDLPFGIDFKSYADDCEGFTSLRLTDTDKGLLQAIIEEVAARK